MTSRDKFRQAYRELRANGRIGYSRLNAPHVRFAAAESYRQRLAEDETTLARRRYTTLETDLFWASQS